VKQEETEMRAGKRERERERKREREMARMKERRKEQVSLAFSIFYGTNSKKKARKLFLRVAG